MGFTKFTGTSGFTKAVGNEVSKIPDATGSCAFGYWGQNPYDRIEADQTPEKIQAGLLDKLIARGLPVRLWLLVDPADAGVVRCTCYKDTTSRSDHKCMTCYGTQYAPGYWRFQHETVFFSSAEYAGFTLTNVERDTSIKPNRLRVVAGSLVGTFDTPDKAFDNPDGSDWEYQVAAFRKTNTDTIDAYFSADGGANWYDITTINGVNKPTGTGSIRFRVSMTRASTTTEPPDFEILRVRHPINATRNSVVTSMRDLPAGQILILRTWEIERVTKGANLGRQVELQGDKSWTLPLNFFDTSIASNTPPARLFDRPAGPHPFFEHAYGLDEGIRLGITQVSFNEGLGTFTHQGFFERNVQEGEVYGLVW